MHRIIVAGGRDFNDSTLMVTELNKVFGDSPNEDFAIVSGLARGADKLAYNLAAKNEIAVHCYPAHWDKFGKSAGYKRNAQMADNADELLAFWDGKSKGTKHMIDLATRKGLIVTVINY